MTKGLSKVEDALLAEQRAQLWALAPYHRMQTEYMEGTAPFKSLGISIPPSLESIGTVVSWPRTVASVPAERIRWRSWLDPNGLGLDEIARDALVGFEVSQSTLEAGVYGQGFFEVSEGAEDEPEVVVQALPATQTTGIWDARKHRLGAGYTTWQGADGTVFEKLFTATDTITIDRTGEGKVIDRVTHDFGRPQVVRQANNMRPSRPNGQSDINRFIRYYTDNAVRSILGMEVSREFYVNPQKWAIGLEAEDFGIDPDAPPAVRRTQGWTAATGALLVAPPNEDGDQISLGQFRSEGPSAFWETVRYLAQMTANEAGLPESYLGFATENPASADAIRAHEYRLVQKCKARLDMGSWASREVALLSLLVRDGDVDFDSFRQVSTAWEDVETPTKAASADAAMKLVGAGIMPADSQVTRDWVGFTDQQQEILASEKRANAVRSVIEMARTQSDSNPAEEPAAVPDSEGVSGAE